MSSDVKDSSGERRSRSRKKSSGPRRSSKTGEHPTCHTCKKPIMVKRFCKVGNFAFHKKHFRCCVCSESLLDKEFHINEDQFYCSKDFKLSFCPTCPACGKKILTGNAIVSGDNYYHPEHFVCTTCEVPLDEKYFTLEDRPYCERHYWELVGDKCAKCGEPIADENEKAEIQDRSYHINCIVCHYCREPLVGSDVYQRHGATWCRKHFSDFFLRRCTACGDHIRKKCIIAVDEYYHPDCLECSVCKDKLDTYICIDGHLRCEKHADLPCDLLVCDVCSELIDPPDNLVRCIGMSFHGSCFQCQSCEQPLEKKTAKLVGNELCCPGCLLNKRADGSTVVPKNKKGAGASKKTQNSEGKSGSGHAQQKSSNDQFLDDLINAGGDEPQCNISWRKGDLLGKGSFGKVYLAMNEQTGELIAVKQIRLSSNEDFEQARSIQSEIETMRRLRHENIVSLLGTQRSGSKLNILMEYVPGKSIDALLQKFGVFSEDVIRSYTKQLLSALAYCHSNHVVHRDIKGKNILVDQQGHLKLADFGSAKHMDNIIQKDSPSVGYSFTPLFCAPEVLTGKYHSAVDIWSLGCVIIEMATAKPPWSEHKFENPFRALYFIGNSKKAPKLPDKLSEAAIDFLNQCFILDPDKRAMARDLVNHRWLRDEDDTEGKTPGEEAGGGEGAGGGDGSGGEGVGEGDGSEKEPDDELDGYSDVEPLSEEEQPQM